MSYLHEPNNHPALTKEGKKEFPAVKLDRWEDVPQYYEGLAQASVFEDDREHTYSEDYITWLEELAFKQLTK